MLILSSFACKSDKIDEAQKLTKFYFVNYNMEFPSQLYLDTIKVNLDTKIQDSIYSLTYLYTNDTITYNLKESENYQPKYCVKRQEVENSDFVFVSKKVYQINGQKFEVYKYAKNPKGIDGCVTHFWTPKIGVIIKRSATWRNFSKLQTIEIDLNQKINLLAELIYQDTEFYKGCVQEQKSINK